MVFLSFSSTAELLIGQKLESATARTDAAERSDRFESLKVLYGSLRPSHFHMHIRRISILYAWSWSCSFNQDLGNRNL